MTASTRFTVHIFILFAGLSTGYSCFAQPILNAQQWANGLADKGQKGNESFNRIDSVLTEVDSTRTFQFLNELAGKKTSNQDQFLARLYCLRAKYLYYKSVYEKKMQGDARSNSPVKDEVKKLMAMAMDYAYRSEDNHLIVLISSWYSQTIFQFGEIGLAVMYATNAIDLGEKIAYKIRPYDYMFLAEMLYRVRDYNSSINYAHKAATAWKNSADEEKDKRIISSLNTVALDYHRQNKYDSAFVYYQQALQLAKQINTPVWVGIVSGNMAQIYYAQKQYDTAYHIFINDYKTSSDSGFYDNASNSLQWAARTNLALGNKAIALKEVREAFQLIKLWPDAAYLRNTYFTTMQVFREMGNYDSAFYYSNLYTALNDSLERVVSRSSTDIAKARLNDEASRYNIQTLNREKRAEILIRNVVIAGIIVLSFMGLSLINRRRLKEKMQLQQEKLLMEQEINSAREQMKMFTGNIIEKTNLIERLESQIKDRQATAEQQAIINELTQQTILTEDDWLKFKTLFEKIYPGFFKKLKDKFPDITLAEQRTASLVRLQLTARQIASILGISVDSVHKSRQRLRHRFQVGADANLEELMTNLW